MNLSPSPSTPVAVFGFPASGMNLRSRSPAPRSLWKAHSPRDRPRGPSHRQGAQATHCTYDEERVSGVTPRFSEFKPGFSSRRAAGLTEPLPGRAAPPPSSPGPAAHFPPQAAADQGAPGTQPGSRGTAVTCPAGSRVRPWSRARRALGAGRTSHSQEPGPRRPHALARSEGHVTARARRGLT